MSFSHDVKTELCTVTEEDAYVKKAEAYGLLLFGRSFTSSGFLLQTEHEDVYDTAATLLDSEYGIKLKPKNTCRRDGRGFIALMPEKGNDALHLFLSFGYDQKTVSLRINRANIEGESAIAAFLRGVFLSCGTVVDPEKDYHLEFVTPYLNLSRDLLCLLLEHDFEPKSIERKGNHVVYFKDSEQIEDLLTYMGAARQSLELMNVKIYKDFRNKANRVTNCETANIEKTVNASTSQIEAINKLIRRHGIETLPDDLREIAMLRLQYPEVSLRELGGMLQVPLSRSGVNHRLRKLLELSAKC